MAVHLVVMEASLSTAKFSLSAAGAQELEIESLTSHNKYPWKMTIKPCIFGFHVSFQGRTSKLVKKHHHKPYMS